MAVYQSTPAAALQLSHEARTMALELLGIRPAVLPGTRAILSETEAKRWFTLVSNATRELKLTDSQIAAFCDLAGVPD